MRNIADEYISCSDNTKIYHIDQNSDTYLDEVILLYGEANSGKTTILKHILYLLKDHISIPFAFVPTNYINNSFRNIIPGDLIYKEVDIDSLKNIWEEQGKRARKFRIANDMNVLNSLFTRIASKREISIRLTIIEKASITIKTVSRDLRMDLGIRRAEQKRIEKDRDKNLKKLFKECIRQGKHKLRRMQLYRDENIALKYIDFRPHIILIFDDCLSTAAKWRNEEVFKQLFMEGRHSFITQIYTLQDDKGIPPDLRRNGRISIFTSSNLASTHFETKSNGYSLNDRKKAQLLIDRIFEHKKGAIPHFQKLVYNKTNNTEKFKFIVADIHDNDFSVGSTYMHKFVDKLPRKNEDEFLINRGEKEYLN